MRGLTLLQVIVVIALIGILAAILLPIQREARQSAKRAQCLMNLRQLGTALTLYADSPSNGGFYPTDSFAPDDPFAATGGAASMGMLYRQFVSDPRIYSCPLNPVTTVPLVKSIKSWPEEGPRKPMLSPEQTSYAYDPGHRAQTNSRMVLIADKLDAKGLSNAHSPTTGLCVLFGTTSEFRDSVQNPIDEKGVRIDPNIFERNPELPRDDDSVLRP